MTMKRADIHQHAAHSAARIYEQWFPQIARTAWVDGTLRVVVARVEGWSPRTSFETQRKYYRQLCTELSGSGVDAFSRQRTEPEVRWKAESKELVDWAWSMLRDGADPAEVQTVVEGEQVWPFMAVATSATLLERALAWMYEHAWVELRRGGELDVDEQPTEIPGGLAVNGFFWTR